MLTWWPILPFRVFRDLTQPIISMEKWAIFKLTFQKMIPGVSYCSTSLTFSKGAGPKATLSQYSFKYPGWQSITQVTICGKKTHFQGWLYLTGLISFIHQVSPPDPHPPVPLSLGALCVKYNEIIITCGFALTGIIQVKHICTRQPSVRCSVPDTGFLFVCKLIGTARGIM